MTLTLRCPHCKEFMKYLPRNNSKNKRKVCVYCGKSFSVNRENIFTGDDENIAQKRLDFEKQFS